MPEATWRSRLAEWPIVERIAAAEWRLGLRSGGFWALVGACALVAVFACGERGVLASVAAARLQQLTRTVLALFFLLWWAMVASRDSWNDVEEMLLSKPVRSEWLALGKFVGNFALVVLAWLLMAFAGLAAQGAVAHTPLQISPYLHALLRVLPGLFFFSALSYTFVLLGRSPVAAALVGLYWLFTLLATDFLSRIFGFFWSQNAGLYVPLGLGILALALGAYQARRRSRPWKGLIWAGAALVLIAAGLGFAVHQVRTGHDPPLSIGDVAWAISSQYLQDEEQIPGFWVKGAREEWVRLSAHPDHILVVALWSPYQADSGGLLQALQQIWDTYRDRKVACVAVAISEEHRIARDFVREQGWTFPIGVDTGAREKPLPSEGSPVAEAYDADALPMVVVADRRRRVVGIHRTWSSATRASILSQIEKLLRRYPLSGPGEATP